MKRRSLIMIFLLGAAPVILLVLYLRTQADSGRFSVTSTGPLDIRFWGIRPDAGDSIYDPKGRKVGETLGLIRGETTVWSENLQRCDFIFEMADINESITFRRLRYSTNGKEGRKRNFLQGSHYFIHKGKTYGWFQTMLPRTTRRSLFVIWSKDIPIDRIDLSLRYYCGPPRNPICVFKGPFVAGSKVTDKTGFYEISFVQHPDISKSELVMRFCPRQHVDPIADALFYDVEGKCHYVRKSWPFTRSAGKEIGYSLPRIPLKNIALITIGEEPFGITVKNLKIRSPNSEHRLYAEYLDKIAERLDPKRKATRLARFNITDIDEALKVIDLLRGEQIYRFCRHLCFRPDGKPGLDPETLNAEQLQRLKQAAIRWATAMDPEIRAQAVRLGLHCKWPEFVDLAFDLLEYPRRNRFSTSSPAEDVARALSLYNKRLSERDIKRIAEFLSRQSNRSDFHYLQNCLESHKSPARIRALWDLAGCDQPWLWTDAIRQLSRWHQLNDQCDALPEKLKPRVFLIEGADKFSDPDQIAPEASALLLTLLSNQLLSHYSSTYGSLLRHVPEGIDRRAMTEVMIESLRRMEYHRSWSIWGAISRIIKYLNLWHSLNIGGLGSDVRKKTPDLDKIDFEAVAAEAVEWYDTIYKDQDLNEAR